MTETQTTIPSRIAGCSATTISGVAIAAGDVTRGLNGKKKWEAEPLRAAASSLEGVAVDPLHSEQEVGTVEAAAWDPQTESIVYEAELEDEKLAQQVRDGHLEVSINARHGKAGEDDETGAMLVDNIKFTGLSLVQHGASPSATAEEGPAPEQALAAQLSAADIQAALESDFRTVAGVRFHDTEPGELDESALDAEEHDLGDHYLYGSGDNKEDYSYPVVDAEGRLRRGNVDSAHSLGCRGQCDDADRHEERLQKLAQQFDSPPVWATDDAAAAGADSPAADSGDASDDPTGASSSGADADPAATEATMSNDDSDPDPEERVTELKAELSDRQERINELEAEVELLKEERDDVARAYASALVEHGSMLDEDELVEKFDVAELAAKVDDIEEALQPDADTDPDPDVQSGVGETAELSGEAEDLVAELGVADRDEAVELLESQYEQYEAAGWESNAEQAKQRLETLGVEV